MSRPLCPWALIVLLLLPLPSALRAGAKFWVATTGDDAAPGSEAAPFATLGRAKEAVREALAGGVRGKILVNVHGGTYRLTAPLEFTPADSARNARVTYRAMPGETPVVTGAIPVVGWEQVSGRLYKADLSAQAPTPTRQLHVNGQRAVRARTPDYPASFRPLIEQVDGEWQAPGIEFIPNPVLNPGLPDPATWARAERIEALLITQWKMSICRIDAIAPAIDLGGGVVLPGFITLQSPGWENANVFRDPDSGAPSIWSFWQVTRFENALEFLDAAGEWYYDEDAFALYYMPRWGEDLAAATVEMPQLERLITIQGAPGDPVRNLVFQGFTFRGATWNGPGSAEGYVADQSGFRLVGANEPNYIGHAEEVVRTPGNVSLEYAQGIEFRDNVFEQLGAVAVDLAAGCVGNVVESNVFRDISSAAVQVGGVGQDDARPADPAAVCRKNRIANNRICRTGQDYVDTAAIFIGFARETLVDRNTIVEVPWSGIAIGWGWGLLDPGSFPGAPGAVSGQWGTFDTPTVAARNRITNNLITGFLGVLWDGGAIYTNGQQGPDARSGTFIAGNVAYGKRPLAGGNTYYTDGGSRHVRIKGNVSYDNPPGVTWFGLPPSPLDPLPYPDLAILNGIPYGGEIGGCRPYGDIRFQGNYLANVDFHSVAPYVDPNGVTYPVGLEYTGNRLISGVEDVPAGILRKAGSSLFR